MHSSQVDTLMHQQCRWAWYVATFYVHWRACFPSTEFSGAAIRSQVYRTGIQTASKLLERLGLCDACNRKVSHANANNSYTNKNYQVASGVLPRRMFAYFAGFWFIHGLVWSHWWLLESYLCWSRPLWLEHWWSNLPGGKRNSFTGPYKYSEYAIILLVHSATQELMVDRLDEIFNEHDEREPLFLYFAPQNPHTPSQPTDEFLAMYSEEKFPDFLRRTYNGAYSNQCFWCFF